MELEDAACYKYGCKCEQQTCKIKNKTCSGALNDCSCCAICNPDVGIFRSQTTKFNLQMLICKVLYTHIFKNRHNYYVLFNLHYDVKRLNIYCKIRFCSSSSSKWWILNAMMYELDLTSLKCS